MRGAFGFSSATASSSSAAGWTAISLPAALRSTSWVDYPATPTVVNGMNTVTVNMTNVAGYFRLRAP